VGGIDRVLNWLERIASAAACSLVAAIVVILGAQIFARFVLNRSLIWSEEVATWCMVWVVYLGSAVLMRHNGHVGIPFVLRVLPLRLRVVAIMLGRAATLLCVIYLTWYGVQVVIGTFNYTSESTGIDTRWIKLCVPIGSGLMTVFACANLVAEFLRLRRFGARGFVNYPPPDLPLPVQRGGEQA
jgi:TRAP-type transport system small permease protein